VLKLSGLIIRFDKMKKSSYITTHIQKSSLLIVLLILKH